MIFAAGLGTRLRPFTDHHPKALAQVNNKSLLQRNIEYLRSAGVSEIIINVHHFAGQITGFLEANDNFGCKILISRETEELLETGGGLKKASWFFNDGQPFLVMNVDILTNLNIPAFKKFHKLHDPLVSLAVTDRASSRNFLFNGEGQLCGWKNSMSRQERISLPSEDYISKAFSGIQMINPRIFPLIEEQGKFSLVDLYLRLAGNHPILAYDHSGDILVDVGKPEMILLAEKQFS